MSKKLGITKRSRHEAIKSEAVVHKHVPGVAYEITNPTEKLIHMIGGGFFNEPKYYDSKRTTVAFYIELLTTGKISSVIVNELGLSEQAKEVLETAQAIATGPNPEDLLVIAAWARDSKSGLKLRYTPQILLCVAAANKATRPFVSKYAKAIIQRADEIRHVFAAYRHLFCSKKNGRTTGAIPKSLRRALALAFATTKTYGLCKYNTPERPTFGDVLLMCKGGSIKRYLERRLGRELTAWPTSHGMFEYLVNNKITADAPNMLQQRAKFFAMKNLNEVSKELLDNAGLTWENIISHFGSTKESWEMAIPYMGEMALTRNLRNFEQAGISEEAWDLVYANCTSVTDTRQLPFRFFAADKETSGTNSKSVVGRMLDAACNSVPGLTGKTAIFVDNSGSTVGCAISGHSTMRVADTGNMLAAIIAKKIGRKCMIGVFGDCCVWVPFAETDSCMAIKKRIDSVAQVEERSSNGALAISSQWGRGRGVGQATETGLWCGLHDLTERKVEVERIIIVSDFCCYTLGNSHNCGQDMNKYFGKGGSDATIQSMIERYRMKVNADAWVHSINLNGHGQSQTKPGTNMVQCLSGWSEQVFGIIHAAEAMTEQRAKDTDSKEVQVPTIDLLRERYLLMAEFPVLEDSDETAVDAGSQNQ